MFVIDNFPYVIIYLFIYLFVCLSICLFISLFICLSVDLSICLSIIYIFQCKLKGLILKTWNVKRSSLILEIIRRTRHAFINLLFHEWLFKQKSQNSLGSGIFKMWSTIFVLSFLPELDVNNFVQISICWKNQSCRKLNGTFLKHKIRRTHFRNAKNFTSRIRINAANITKIKDKYEVVFHLSCFVRHPVKNIHLNAKYEQIFHVWASLIEIINFIGLQRYRH